MTDRVLETNQVVDRLVDWEFAAATAKRLSAAGPQIGWEETAQVVGELRECAVAARSHVAEITELDATDDAAVVLVVDRQRWVEANLQTLRAILSPVVDSMAARRGLSTRHTGNSASAQLFGSVFSGAMSRASGTVTGGQAGGLLAFLSSKVLGQYDLAPGGTPRLLLVAPNLVQAEQEMTVAPSDFRLWVCLHEETHRMQFTAVPWLREHLLSQAATVASQLAPDPASLVSSLTEVGRRVPQLWRDEDGSLVDLFASSGQREQLARMTAVMSLLEGHADVVMDAVGPQVVPTVQTIRSRFTQRRAGVAPVDRMLRKLLGVEAKMRQYRDGAHFVREVIAAVQMAGFNRVWTSPNTLPSPAEISDPRAWLRRVHG